MIASGIPVDLKPVCLLLFWLLRVKSEALKMSGMPLHRAWHQHIGRRAARVTPGRLAGLGAVLSRGIL